MKHILLLAAIIALALGSSSARVEKRNIYNSEVKTMANNVPGATINAQGDHATTKKGYVFAQEGPKSISVIRTGRSDSVRLQTGSLECVPVDKTDTYDAYCAAFIQSNTSAYCQGRGRCHFVGILGGVRAP